MACSMLPWMLDASISLLVLAISSSCFVLLPAVLAAEESGKPRIACAVPDYDFGSKDNQESVEHAFTIRNDGGTPLHIQRVTGGCCGATAALSASTIEPGGEAALRVTFSLRGRKGRQAKVFYLASDDPTQAILRLSVQGAATVPVDIEPQGLDFGRLAANAVSQKPVAIRCQPGFDFAITNVTTTAPWVNAAFTSADRRNHAAQIRTVPPIPAGVTRCNVLLFTDSPRERFRRIEIAVVVSTAGDITAVPNEMLLLVGRNPTPVTRHLAIRSRSGQTFRILGVDVPQAGVASAVSPAGANGYRCEMRDILPAEDLDGEKIVITTDSTETPRLEVPIRILR